MGSGSTVGIKGGEISHCFVFRGETFVEWIGDLFGDLTEVVDVIVSFINPSHANASGRIDERVVSVSG